MSMQPNRAQEAEYAKQAFLSRFHDMIEKSLREEAEILLKEIEVTLRERVRSRVAKIAVQVAEMTTIEHYARELVIRVKFDG